MNRSAAPHAPSSAPVPASVAPHSAVVERNTGDYELLRRLGSGAMGEVWLGKHRVTGGLAAVKLLRTDAARRERVRAFFARERRAIAKLDHPHIVQLHGFGPGWIATAFIDGSDLARRSQTPLEARAVIRYALQIASALAHAHACGVIHRDVKPSNILVDRRGNAYLADFGLAAVFDESGASGADERAGTPAFMAPEQGRGDIVGPAADQFALARTLIELLAGVSVAQESDAFALLPGSLPAALVDALRRATTHDPAGRFASMDDFAAALANVPVAHTEAPMRLAPELRVRGPFGWCTGAYEVKAVTPEIHRAEYSLSGLEKAGLLTREACADFRERSGYEEIAWTAFAHEGRLGHVASDGALARASDVVVILHGLLCGRRDWREAAAAICRDNAQAVVLIPDLYGCGDSIFVDAEHASPHATLDGMLDAVLRWLALLSVSDMPTVLVGHSLSGSALLSVRDDVLGERVARVAITPVIDSSSSPLVRKVSVAIASVAMSELMRRPMAALLERSADLTRLAPEPRRRLVAEFRRAPGWLLQRLTDEFKRVRLVPADSLRRCAVLVGEDDPYTVPDAVHATLVAHGMPEASVHRIVGTGHYPHVDNEPTPEAKARNLADITRVVDAMLGTSREGALLDTFVASTVLSDDPTDPMESGVRSDRAAPPATTG